MSIDEIHRFLSICAKYELHEDLWWRTDGEYAPVTFFIVCNDVFWWATADLELVKAPDIDALEQAGIDCVTADPRKGVLSVADLYCARKRGMRPQGAAYPSSTALWPLFDAAGSERNIEFSNPCGPGKKSSA